MEEGGQEDSAQEGEHSDDPLCADLTGMGKEVENLIKENTELLETKNALNIVKNDLIAQVDQLNSEHDIFREEVRSLEMVKNKMSERIRELEAEVRELKEKHNKEEQDEQGEEIPMAQRKRFTRQEMARVLMERNYYKEKLMELQDTVKFAESQRARKIAAQQINSSKKGGIWDFFSGLFSAENPTGTPTSGRRRPQPSTDSKGKKIQAKPTDFVDPDRVNEKRMQERREQYKAVSEHVRKENNNRTHAYGWSIPNTADTSLASTIVPVPIYCRPVLDHEPNLKIWCADSVSLCGGRTKDGGFIVGDSVFYTDPPESREPTPPADQTQQQRDHKEYEEERSDRSSLIWVGSSNQGRSHVAVLDANVANKVLDVFHVCNSHLLCISSVPGVREYDYPAEDKEFSRQGGYVLDVPSDMDDQANLGAVEFITMKEEETADGIPTYSNDSMRPSISATPSVSSVSPQRSRDFSINDAAAVGTSADLSLNSISDLVRTKVPEEPEKEAAALAAPGEEDVETAEEAKSDVYDVNVDNSYRLLEMGLDRFDARKAAEASNSKGFDALPAHIKAGLCKYEGLGTITTALPTMWMGSQDEYIYIHSGVSEWRRCLRKIKMPDAVLDIRHYKGHVFAALANGCVAVFTRDADGHWSDEGYHLITIGKVTSSVRHLAVVAGKIWAAYRNCVVVISPQDLTIEKVFVAHPRRDSQVRNMQWVGDGVWISIRLDSTLRLYHAHTYQHLQDVDIEPYVTKMLGTSKLDFSYVRPTGLLVSNSRLWIGTGTGVIISVPLNEKEQKPETKAPTRSPGPGGVVRVYSDKSGDKVSVGTSFIPYCNLTQAQLSFHGHKDAVKFFLAVPAGPSSKGVSSAKEAEKTLVVSGGDGYIDFRIGEPNEQPVLETSAESARELSHLIIWETDRSPNT
uniref:RH2 domain-containing protein n=1 Tax=Steinernema glaseri TaxID=37863 RepID=A0A1I7Y9E8_9BILA